MNLRAAKLSGTVYCADGTTLFNGWAYFVLVLPGQNGQSPAWPRITFDRGYPTVQAPLWTAVKITDGLFAQDAGLWYTSDLLPYNSQYSAYYYDRAGVKMGGPTELFSVTTTPVTPPFSQTVSPVAADATRTIPTPAEVV